MAVLDNFHFDLSLAQSLHQEDEITDNKRQASPQKLSEEDISLEKDTKTEAEDVTGLESEESQEEVEMEEESESVQEEKERKSVGEEDVVKQRAMAQKIHKAIVHSILPSLEGVLTKRVRNDGLDCAHIQNFMYFNKINVHVHVHIIYYM